MDKAEIDKLAEKWYKLLDIHAPVTEFLPLLDNQELVMEFPEATLHGLGEFSDWLAGVVRIFFDEEHTVKKVYVKKDKGTTTEVEVVVNWKARRWNAPAARSEYLDFDAYQTWVLGTSSKTGKPVIVKYIVDKLEALPGSAEL